MAAKMDTSDAKGEKARAYAG